MFDQIIHFSVKNRFLVFVLTAVLIGVGLDALRNLPIDAVPDVTNVQVQVLTTVAGPRAGGGRAVHHHPGRDGDERPAAARGDPLDLEVRPLRRHRRLRGRDATSTSPASSSASGCQPRGRASRRATAAPEMGPISTGLGEIYQFEVRGRGQQRPWSCAPSSSGRSPRACARVPGVVEVNTFGGELKTYEVQLDPARLTALRGLARAGVRGARAQQRERGRRLHRARRRSSCSSAARA